MSVIDAVSGGRVGGALATIGTVVLSLLATIGLEATVIAAAVAFGPFWGGFVVFAVCLPLSSLIVFAFDAEESRHGALPLVARVRRWIEGVRTRAELRARRVAHLAPWIGLVVLSVTVGPLLTTVVVKLRGTEPRQSYLLAAGSCALFSAVWTGIYSVGVAGMRAAF